MSGGRTEQQTERWTGVSAVKQIPYWSLLGKRELSQMAQL